MSIKIYAYIKMKSYVIGTHNSTSYVAGSHLNCLKIVEAIQMNTGNV